MFASMAGRAVFVMTVASLMAGCSTFGVKTAPTQAGAQASSAAPVTALDADIQRILAAGGIEAAPLQLPPAQAPAAPTAAPPAASALPRLPPPPTGTPPVSSAAAPDAAARLDLSALPGDGATTDPIVSTTATYDFSTRVSAPQSAVLPSVPQSVGASNASVSAGILPAVPITTQVTAVTGVDASPPPPARPAAVRPVFPVAIPPEIEAIRRGNAAAPPQAVAAATPSVLPTASLPPAVAPAAPILQEFNSDRPLQPVKRF